MGLMEHFRENEHLYVYVRMYAYTQKVAQILLKTIITYSQLAMLQ